jgi:hypothetical protein
MTFPRIWYPDNANQLSSLYPHFILVTKSLLKGKTLKGLGIKPKPFQFPIKFANLTKKTPASNNSKS